MFKKTVVGIVLAIALIATAYAQAIPTFNAADKATHWIATHVSYCNYASSLAEGRTPEAIYTSRIANCTDMAILLVAILIKSGADPDLITYVGIKDNKGHQHLLVKYDGMYFDATADTYSYRFPTGYYQFIAYSVDGKQL